MSAAAPPPDPARRLPASLLANPHLARWIKFLPDETARIATGKVEIGQGVVTAIAQIAAEELGLPLERVVVLSGDTDEGPDELYTSSSLSISVSGASVRLVCAEARALLLERAALRLNCSPEELSVNDGAFFQNGEATGFTYWSVAPEVDWSREATGRAVPKAVGAYEIVGRSVPRRDLPAKLSGPPSFTTWRRPTCCMPARYASRAAARRWHRWTRLRSARPPAAKSRSCGRLISSPSSASTRPRPKRPAPPRPNMRAGTAPAPSTPRKKRRSRSGTDRRLTANWARRRTRRHPGNWSRRLSRAPMWRTPRWRPPARWRGSRKAT